jgi:hypothetical protein
MAKYTIDRNLEQSINESYEQGNHYSAFATKELIRALLTSRHLEDKVKEDFEILDVRGEGLNTWADATVIRVGLDGFFFDITITMDGAR